MNGRCILPIAADVIATVAYGIATFLECLTVADVITTVADGIATFVGMFHCGRWNNHWVNV